MCGNQGHGEELPPHHWVTHHSCRILLQQVCPYLPQGKHRSILVSISKALQYRVRVCFLKVLKLQWNVLSSLKCVQSIAGTIAESIWNQCDREGRPQSKTKLYTCWWLSFASKHPERLSSVFSQSACSSMIVPLPVQLPEAFLSSSSWAGVLMYSQALFVTSWIVAPSSHCL